jgi:dTDP-4-amino-4,6-dideoxygalactose transaminase
MSYSNAARPPWWMAAWKNWPMRGGQAPKLDEYPHVLAERRRLAARARAELEPLGFSFQAGSEGSPWQFIPLLAEDAATRDRVLESCRRAGIETRV